MITNANQSYEPHRDDLLIKSDDWTAQYRAAVAAQGGTSTLSAVEAMAGRLRTALAWSVADGRVLFRPHGAAGGFRLLSGPALATWSAANLGQLDHLPAADWVRVAELAEATVRADHARAVELVPADVRAADDARARQQLVDRRAEIEAQAARLAAELAAIDDGAEPVAGVGPADQPRPRWRRSP